MRKEVCKFAPKITPYQIILNPRALATGAKIGTTIKAISKKSIKNPNRKTTNILRAKKPTPSPGKFDRISNMNRSPWRPRKTKLKAVEPIKINRAMLEMRRVASQESRRATQLNWRFNRARAIAPKEPTAPASVGVAMPKKMLPNTNKISTNGGNMDCTTRCRNSRRGIWQTSGGRAGAASGFKKATSNTCKAKAPAIIRPGITAPRNRLPTETPNWSPSTTSTTLGGMICPKVPEAAITPVASSRL